MLSDCIVHTGLILKIFYYPAGGAGNDLSNTVMAALGIRNGNSVNSGEPENKAVRSMVATSTPIDSGLYRRRENLGRLTFAWIDHAVKYGGFAGLRRARRGDGADETEFKASMDSSTGSVKRM